MNTFETRAKAKTQNEAASSPAEALSARGARRAGTAGAPDGPTQVGPMPPPPTTAPADIADPALREKHRDGSMEYKRYAGDLFINGVAAGDVIQGQIADCYLVSALASAAATHPDLITSGIKDSGSGAYEVRFFERQWDGKYKDVWVKVDADLPTSKGGSKPAYATSSERNDKGVELWPAIYEKAYAAWKKGYDKMGEGGSSQAALEALVGAKVGVTTLASTPEDEIWKKLQAASKDGKIIKAASAGTHGKDQDAIYKGTNLYAWHAYSILGCREANGQRHVTLRNPWGSTEPGQDGKDDGVFELTLKDFVKFYNNMNLEL